MVNDAWVLDPAAKLAVQIFQGVGCADRLPHRTRELVEREQVATCLLQASNDGWRQRVPFGYELVVSLAGFDAILRADDPVVVMLELTVVRKKVDPALIARFRPAMLGCFVPVDPTSPPAS